MFLKNCPALGGKMHFTESKKRTPWIILLLVLLVGVAFVMTFCHFEPTPKTVQRTIVFEAD